MTIESNEVIPLPEHRRNANKFLTDVPTLITSLFSDVEIILPDQEYKYMPLGRRVKIDDSWTSADRPITQISSPSLAELLDISGPDDEFTLREFLEFDAHERDKETAICTRITTSYSHFSREDFQIAKKKVGNLAREHGGILKADDLRFLKTHERVGRKFGNSSLPNIPLHMRIYTFE